MKAYLIFSLCLIGCGSSAPVVESYNELGERIVIAENDKVELAMVDIGKACKEQGFAVISRGGSITTEHGTRIVAKCGKESVKSDIKRSWFSL